MEPAPCNREPLSKAEKIRRALRLAGLGWELVITVGIFIFIGVQLYRRTGSKIPLIAIPLIGVAVAMWRFIIAVLKNMV